MDGETHAVPLQRRPKAARGLFIHEKRATGVEPATFGLGSRRSAN